ncbi:unnamed protein product [Anisakis simplex]|uniref:G-protein coupled receptors family 1 profile domain-containing protein n=1 Tax=Anisakis simplex TaxID=6269 RepID=A0A0M3JCL5_ANISI|nr:unnamed protein product [Anisakis simplex]VDK25075.1 unnamed protein product [Anisakis simplex]
MCSACNPLLYTLFSKKFRARITRLLRCDRAEMMPKRCDITNSIVKVMPNSFNELSGRSRLEWRCADDFTPTHYYLEVPQ